MTYQMTDEDRRKYDAHCKRADKEMLGRVKMLFPLDDVMQCVTSSATDEKVLRDANLAAQAIAKLVMVKEPALAGAVTRLIGYVVRTMGPDTAEQMAVAMHDMFELMETMPERPGDRWKVIKDLDNAQMCIIAAYRAINNLSFHDTMEEWRENNPEAARRVTATRQTAGELALFADNPLTGKEITP